MFLKNYCVTIKCLIVKLEVFKMKELTLEELVSYCKNYGFVFSFFSNTKYLYMSEPEGYNPNDVSSIINSTDQTM